MAFFEELKRRNVLRVAAGYAVAAWLLIQIAELIFPLFGFDDTPARVVVIVLAVGFIPALIIAWAFEITPSGLVRDAEVDHSLAVNKQAAKRFDRIVMVVLALAVAFFAVDRFVFQETREIAIAENVRIEMLSQAIAAYQVNPSIAVLPFADLSPGGGEEVLADGIAGELLDQLSRLQGINVASRRSAFAFKGSTETAPLIAEKLGVDYLLEGSVRRNGDSLLVTAQLIHVVDGVDRQVLPVEIEENYRNIFYVQEEIAKAVAAALSIALDADDRSHLPGAGTDDIEAYEAFLAGRSAEGKLGPSYAEPNYRRATEIDPNYYQAWHAYGVSVGLQTDRTSPKDTRRQVERGRDLVTRAIELEPAYAAAYASLGAFNRVLGNFPAAVEAVGKAAELAPGNLQLQISRNGLFHRLGHIREGIRSMELGRQVQPLHYYRAQTLAELYLQDHQYDKAREILDISATFPIRDEPSIIKRHIFIALAEGDGAAARRLLQDYIDARPRDAPLFRPVVDAFDSSPAQVLEVLKKSYEGTAEITGEGRVISASIAAYFGDQDFAIEVLSTEFDFALGRFHRVWHPHFSDMRRKPAFRQLLVDLGLDQIYREYGWPDRCQPLQNDDFECY